MKLFIMDGKEFLSHKIKIKVVNDLTELRKGEEITLNIKRVG